MFTNRVLPRSRPEYADYLKYLNIPVEEREPVAFLARSGGRRVTDTLEVFPCPEPDAEGNYEVYFPIRGLSHMPVPSVERASKLNSGESLLLMPDPQNPRDPDAIALRTAEKTPGDLFIVGYCPRYLRKDLKRLLEANADRTFIEVVRVNLPPAPVQFRVLCKAVLPSGSTLCNGPEFHPLVENPEAMLLNI